jgi:hypothetical protein
VSEDVRTSSLAVIPPWMQRMWLAVCLVLATLWCVTASTRLSATYDEPCYLTNGLEHWRSGSYELLMNRGTMPLPIDVISLPLYVWEKWRGTPFRMTSTKAGYPLLLDDLSLLLPWARLGTLVFLWLLIGYGWLLGKRLAGSWGGSLAAALLAAEPSILAHSSLATTDISVAACLLALVYHFDQGRGQSWGKRVALPGLWFGLAVLSKASALVFAFLCLITMEWIRLIPGSLSLASVTEETSSEAFGSSCEGVDKRPPERMGFRRVANLLRLMSPFGSDMIQIMAIAIALTLIYVGTDFKLDPALTQWADSLGDSNGARIIQWLSHHVRIFPNAGVGLVRQVQHNMGGHAVYLLGESYPNGVWYYFPVLLIIKMTVAMLLAPLVVLALRPKKLANWIFACSLVLLVLSFAYRVQIGIRIILPLVALWIVGISAALVETGKCLAGAKQRIVAVFTIFCLGWAIGSAVGVWPHGLCYVNELWGSTLDGYQVVSDSNYDWGQGLKELDEWRRDHGIAEMELWHFGFDPIATHLPYRQMRYDIDRALSPPELTIIISTGYLAVGTTLLYGPYFPGPEQQMAATLRSVQPVARTMTHFIYIVPERTLKAPFP